MKASLPGWGKAVAAMAVAIGLSCAAVTAEAGPKGRLSRDLAAALEQGRGGDVILQADAATVQAVAARHGVTVRRWLKRGAVLSASRAQLEALAADPAVGHLSGDAPVRSMMAVAAESIGADQAWAGLVDGISAVTGRGVGVAVIDSGVSHHQALKGKVVAAFDFTGSSGKGEDQLGHGTHVAGIVAGNSDELRGVAPGAWIVSLKVLGPDGSGLTSSVIEAIDFAIANKEKYGLRVINLSLGRPVFESYAEDPLCQAVERAYRAGLVVVASAGNFGTSEDGRLVLGGITAPGNSPYAITVGALDDQGTPWRSDDIVADFSSRGPTLFDRLIKPDLAAPGRRVGSAYAPGSTIAKQLPERLVSGNGQNGVFELSGTSMSAAVVSGAAALVLEANPALTPLQVRIALQMSSTFLPNAGLVAAGAGSLNAAAAVSLAQTGPAVAGLTTFIGGESVAASGLTFAETVVWGSARDTIVWGNAKDTIVWGNAKDTIVWGNAKDTIVWGNARETIVWGNARDTIVWGNAETIVWGNTIVWGSAKDTIVWGNAKETIVWGNVLLAQGLARDGDTIVWGNAVVDTIVWGNAKDTIVWGNGSDTIVWGNAKDTIVWGNGKDTIVWGNAKDTIVWGN